MKIPPRRALLEEFSEELCLVHEFEVFFLAKGRTEYYLVFRGTDSLQDFLMDSYVAATKTFGKKGLRFHSDFYHSILEDKRLLENLTHFGGKDSS